MYIPLSGFDFQGGVFIAFSFAVYFFRVSLYPSCVSDIFTGITFKGNLYITDPCYFTQLWDSEDDVIEAPEFTDYLIGFTGIGDGSWAVYKLPESFPADYENIAELIEDTLSGKNNPYIAIGRYSVDSATSCVVYKDEVDAHNPKFAEEFAAKPNCRAIIEDFEGEVRPYEDSEFVIHYIGVGNFSFFTA